MTEYLFTNEARGTLVSAVGSADITFSLQTGEGAEFPSPGAGQAFMAIIYDANNSEWVTCTAVSGDDLTVTRGVPSFSFAVGSTVELRLDEVALSNFLQQGAERIVTSDPDGVLAANYAGEEVYQSVSGVWWKHTTGTTWKAMNL